MSNTSVYSDGVDDSIPSGSENYTSTRMSTSETLSTDKETSKVTTWDTQVEEGGVKTTEWTTVYSSQRSTSKTTAAVGDSYNTNWTTGWRETVEIAGPGGESRTTEWNTTGETSWTVTGPMIGSTQLSKVTSGDRTRNTSTSYMVPKVEYISTRYGDYTGMWLPTSHPGGTEYVTNKQIYTVHGEKLTAYNTTVLTQVWFETTVEEDATWTTQWGSRVYTGTDTSKTTQWLTSVVTEEAGEPAGVTIYSRSRTTSRSTNAPGEGWTTTFNTSIQHDHLTSVETELASGEVDMRATSAPTDWITAGTTEVQHMTEWNTLVEGNEFEVISTVLSTDLITVVKDTEYTTELPREKVSTSWNTQRVTVDTPGGLVDTSQSTNVQTGELKLETKNGTRSFELPYQESVGPKLEAWPVGESRYLLPYPSGSGATTSVREGDLEIYVFTAPAGVSPAMVRRDGPTSFYLQLTGTYVNNQSLGLLRVVERDGDRYIVKSSRHEPDGTRTDLEQYPGFPIWNYSPNQDYLWDERFGVSSGLQLAWKTSNRLTTWTTERDGTFKNTWFSTTRLTEVGSAQSRTTAHETSYVSELINTYFLTEFTSEAPVDPGDSDGDMSTVMKSTSAITIYPEERGTTTYTESVLTDHVTSLNTSFTTTTPVAPESQYQEAVGGSAALDMDLYLRAGEGTPTEGTVYYLYPTTVGLEPTALGDGTPARPIAVVLDAAGNWTIQDGGLILPAEAGETLSVFKDDGAGTHVSADSEIVPIGSAAGAVDDTHGLVWSLHDSTSTDITTSYQTTLQNLTDVVTSRETVMVPDRGVMTEWTTHILVDDASGSTAYQTSWITDGVFVTSQETLLDSADMVARDTSVVTDYTTTYQSAQQTFHQTMKATQGSTELSTVKMVDTKLLTEALTDVFTFTGFFRETLKGYTEKTTTVHGGKITRVNPGDPRSPYTNTSFSSSWSTRWRTERNTYVRQNTKVGERTTDVYTAWKTGKELPTHVATNKETIYDTHYQTFSERTESGQRTTQWSTTPQPGETVETSWEVERPKLTSKSTSFTGTLEEASDPGERTTGVTTEYLTGENSTRYDTFYGTQKTTQVTDQWATSRTTDHFTSTLYTASTEVIDHVEVDTSHLTFVSTNLAGVDTWTLETTQYQTEVENTFYRSTAKPREVLTERVTDWITTHVTNQQVAQLTSHETVAGENLFYTSHETEQVVVDYGPEHLSAQVPQSQVPPLDVIGPFTFTGPFAQYNGQLLKCLSVEDMGLLVKRGVDVHELVYQPYNLNMDAYLADFDAGAKLVTLASVDEHVEVVVPSTYIETMPSGSYVAYSRLILTVDMGLLPDALDLESARAAIASTLQQTLGKAPTVELARLPMEGGVTSEQHAIMEENRQHEIVATPSDKAQIERLERRLAEEIEHRTMLEEILVQTAID